MDSIRVLVTGAGSRVGQGIIKALRISNLPILTLSADIGPLNVALFRTEESLIIPKVESEGSLPIFINLIKEKRIDVIMIGSEFELDFFAEHKAEIEAETGAMIIISPLETISIANDKWLTAEFLRNHRLPYASSYIPENELDAVRKAKEWGYPLILKPRQGTSSRHVYLARSEKDITSNWAQVPHPMLQKLVGMPSHHLDNEYTCSIFKCRDGKILGPFTARRALQGGHSHIVEVDHFQSFYPILVAIGNNLDIMGTLNIQLMAGPDGPVPFELNARFSGTTAVRAHFGFNEPELTLRHYLLGETLKQPLIRKGMAFRYDEEVFLENHTAQDLKEPFPAGEVRKWF